MMSHSSLRGFSLVEMAIVLVVIGLIAGGVIEGQSLVRSAQVKSMITEYRTLVQASTAFKDKYRALPGDMTNATDFWGSAGGASHTNDPTCYAVVSTTTATCNGNGDNIISYGANGDATVAERYLIVKHLSNAGLIPGNYIDTLATNAGYSLAIVGGVNVMASKLEGGYWISNIFGNGNSWYTGNAFSFAGDYGNVLQDKPGTLTPSEAYGVDQKLDDGLPGSGIILAGKGDGTTTFCTTVAGQLPPGDTGAIYKLSVNNTDCQLVFTHAIQ